MTDETDHSVVLALLEVAFLGKKLETVTSFEYLVSVITDDGPKPGGRQTETKRQTRWKKDRGDRQTGGVGGRRRRGDLTCNFTCVNCRP